MKPRNYAQELATYYLYGEPAPEPTVEVDAAALLELVIQATEKRQAEPKKEPPKYFPEEAQSGKYGSIMNEYIKAMEKAQQTSAASPWANPWGVPISLTEPKPVRNLAAEYLKVMREYEEQKLMPQWAPKAKSLCPICGDPRCRFSMWGNQ